MLRNYGSACTDFARVFHLGVEVLEVEQDVK